MPVIIALIHERYPRGVDPFAAHRVLVDLAAVAGDILANGGEPAYEGFVEVLVRQMMKAHGKVNFVSGTLN